MGEAYLVALTEYPKNFFQGAIPRGIKALFNLINFNGDFDKPTLAASALGIIRKVCKHATFLG